MDQRLDRGHRAFEELADLGEAQIVEVVQNEALSLAERKPLHLLLKL